MVRETLISDNAPKALGSYSQGVKVCDYIFLSGQLPIDPATGNLVEGGIKEQTTQCLKNLEAVLQSVGLDLSYVVSVRIYMTDMSEFAEMNEAYSAMFKAPYPARAAVGTSGLLKNAKLEIEAQALDTRALEVICSQEGCQCCSEEDCCECK